MKNDNKVIEEATIDELRDLWWKTKQYEKMSFFTFVSNCKEQGTKIIEVTDNE